MANKFRIALVQLLVGNNKIENVKNAVKSIELAAKNGSSIVALPECFNSPYGVKYFPDYCENIPGETTEALSKAAKDNNIWLVGGSIPEKEGSHIYNTCPVFDNNGNLIAKHRKMHLFDIDIPGKITFKESDALSPGNNFTMIDTPYCRIGIGICYDIRFPEMAMIYRNNNCSLLLYPGAFNLTTGPAHWELLLRSRAVDNQFFVAGISPARCETSDYVAYGYSSLFDPFGENLAKAGSSEEIIYADIDLNRLKEIRTNIPYL